MNFELSDDIKALQAKVRRFITEEVMPMESDSRQTPHGPTEALRDEMVASARRDTLLPALLDGHLTSSTPRATPTELVPHVAPKKGGNLSRFMRNNKIHALKMLAGDRKLTNEKC